MIIEAHADFQTSYVAILIDPDADLGPLSQLATPELAEALTARIASDRSKSVTFAGGISLKPLEIRPIESGVVELDTCIFDQVAQVGEDGEGVLADLSPLVRTSRMVETESGWVMGGLVSDDSSALQCEL